ncbi:GNAT family N-acetyltransferase [Alkalibacterium sp. MB6]|uniref:GNAT family N-acetyltransferase n=1 Tax=Alkalibacterium sp. MB6 TaxID=2081965 RepID=UPI00137A353D|nr:GNAT family N-acetyltransferase [Alkalibacterium sp. MB6]
MIIRQIEKKDLDAYLDLQSYAFPTDPTASSRRERTERNWEHLVALGAFTEQGELQSAMVLRKYNVFLHGQSIKMGGIANVASYPEARGKGNIRALFKEAFKIMKQENMTLSYLAPFSHVFYRQFGYELVFEMREYSIEDLSLVYDADSTLSVKRVNGEEEREILAEVYKKTYQSKVGPVDRHEWVWQGKDFKKEEHYVAICRNEKGEAEGYLLYSFSSKKGRVFNMNELVAMTGRAEKALWSFVGSHRAQFDRFTFETGGGNNLSHLFKEQWAEQKWVSGMMARVVDMERFLSYYPFQLEDNQSIIINVNDETIDWNTAHYTIKKENRSIDIKKNGDGKFPDEDTVSADIKTWSQLFMGARTVPELHFQEKLKGSEEAIRALDKVIIRQQPELYDFF